MEAAGALCHPSRLRAFLGYDVHTGAEGISIFIGSRQGHANPSRFPAVGKMNGHLTGDLPGDQVKPTITV